ncbi:hypothetical protein [Archangium lipolyticum]|uniref:hypothetical protein n=1 Tax=Archangium lipolyticum TaxID=2970465 RepID=UPI00214A6F56|nr:hypothetical protein [Archangium lipolyticum]
MGDGSKVRAPRVLGVFFAAVVLLFSVETWAQGAGKGGTLVFRGLDEQPLRLQLDSAQLDHKLIIDETGNVQVDRAQLLVTDFKDESGVTAYPVQVMAADGSKELEEFSLAPMKSQAVRLVTDIVTPGTYTATLTLVYGGAPHATTQLVVTRPRPALNVELDEVVARGDADVREYRSSAVVDLVLREKEGRPVKLYPPTLAKLTLKSGSAPVVFQTSARVELAGAGDTQGDGPSLLLDRRQTKPLRLVLSELSGAGQYEGTLRIASADAPPVEKTFTLYLRESSWVALVLIALGVIISFVIRVYLTKERPRMVLQHRVLGLAQALEAMKTSTEGDAHGRELAQALQQLVSVASQGLSAFTVNVTAEQVELLERKVSCARNWLRLRRSVEEMQPESLRSAPLAKLGEVERLLRNPGTTGAQLETAEATLAGLPSEMEAAMRQHLTGRLEEFHKELNATMATRDPFAATTRKLEQRVKPSLEQASALVTKDLRAAFTAFDEARAALASLLADELSASLAGPAPGFLSATEWSELKVQVELLLSPLRQLLAPSAEAAVGAYENGLSFYLRTVGRALYDAAGKQLQALGEGQTQQKERVERARTGAESSLRLLGERNLSESLRVLGEARKDFVASTVSSTGLRMGGTQPAPAPAQAQPLQGPSLIPEWLVDSVSLRLPQLEGRAPAEGLAMLEKWLRFADGIILVLMLAVASVAGLKVLWQDNPTWGGMNDRLIALLWGFGVHQISYFAGIGGVLERILKATPMPAVSSGLAAPPVQETPPVPAPAPASVPPPLPGGQPPVR